MEWQTPARRGWFRYLAEQWEGFSEWRRERCRRIEERKDEEILFACNRAKFRRQRRQQLGLDPGWDGVPFVERFADYIKQKECR